METCFVSDMNTVICFMRRPMDARLVDVSEFATGSTYHLLRCEFADASDTELLHPKANFAFKDTHYVNHTSLTICLYV